MPGPHRVGLVQVLTPPGLMLQPWLDSSCCAFAGLYGKESPCLPLADRKFAGVLGTGPTVGTPYPLSGPSMMACWFIRYWKAWRKYVCRKIGPTVGLFWFIGKYWMLYA